MLLLLSALVFLGIFVSISQSRTLLYSESFHAYQSASSQAATWDTYLASLLPSYSYQSFSTSGTYMSTRTCNDPTIAAQIASALHYGTTISVSCGGYQWYVGIGCGGVGAVEFGKC